MIAGHSELGGNRNDIGQLSSIEDRAACVGWITSAAAAVENICAPENSYRTTVQRIADAAHSKSGLMIYEYVLHMSEVLWQLVTDAKAGF